MDHYRPSSLPPTVFDVECYRNFFFIAGKEIETGKVFRFQISPNRRLNTNGLVEFLRTHLLIGFNSIKYDMPLIQLALLGFTTAQLKNVSDEIIIDGAKPRAIADKYGIARPWWDHIDLLEVAPLDGSLKLYAGRLHARRMQDLPIDPNDDITAATAEMLTSYCINDLDNTIVLWNELLGQIKLRESFSVQYNQDLRSKSDAQVAEAIIALEVKKLNGVYPQRPTIAVGTTFKYQIPEYVQYRTPELQAMLEKVRAADFVIVHKEKDDGTASQMLKVDMPKELDGATVKIGHGVYRLGIGGLHSSETNMIQRADDETLLVDRDVASYYPRIILNQRLYPKHLGEAFLTVYQSLVDRRLVAKRAGDNMTAESLKIAVNGSFGKLGSQYSVLYAPDLMIQVTVTGQLALLLLIEMIESAGIAVVSANTDGVVIRCPKARYEELNGVVAAWEKITAFETEETQYRAVYSKDVNNYLAIKTDGKVKGKGLYTNPWEVKGPNVYKLQKNPSTTIVIEAVIAYLRDGVSITNTIMDCQDITKFVAIRTVQGGALYEGGYVGKVVRWFYSTASKNGVMKYKKTGNKVPKTEGAKPLMELPDEFPWDVNYGWYIDEARATLESLGVVQGLFAESSA